MNFIKTYIVLVPATLLMFTSPVFAGTFSQAPDLELGIKNSFVIQLQQFLNSNGYTVNSTLGEPGSKGYESDYFGSLTQKALSLFQSSNNINPAQGYFGTKTKTVIDSQNLSLKDITQTSKSELSAADTTTCSPGQARSITQFSITWYFDKCYQYGTFANGDYWVVGPVVITKITPESVVEDITWTDAKKRTHSGWIKNGTMLNPRPSPDGQQIGQGFDSSVKDYAFYNSNLNVAPSITGKSLSVPNNSSVVSVISAPAPNHTSAKSQIQYQSILTVLQNVPPEGSFRPAMAWSDKSIKWNKSQLNYSILKSFAPVANTPSLSIVEGYFEKPWQTMYEGNQEQSMSAYGNMPDYGRDQAHQVSDGLLSLHLNYSDSQKEKLYIRMVQYGIDVYGSVREVENINSRLTTWGFFRGSGGLNNGRKAPMVLAGLALNDSKIKEWSDAEKHMVFAEDKQTFYVSQIYVSTPRVGVGEGPGLLEGQGCSAWEKTNGVNTRCLRPLDAYTSSMIGTPEWRVDEKITWAGSNWGAFYRWIGGAQAGNALGIRLLKGGVETWNWSAFFDYEDRYMNIDKTAPDMYKAPNGVPPFVRNMWNAYRGGGVYIPPVITQPTDPVVIPEDGEDGQETKPPVVSGIPFAKWNLIKVTSNTGFVNVRNDTYIADTTKIGTQANGVTGQIIDGPIEQDGVRWWKINYDNSEIDGWTGQSNTSGTDNLTVTAIGVESPTILVSPKIISPRNNQEFPSDTKKMTVVWENKNTNYLVRYKEINGSEKQINTHTDESIDINVKEGESYVFWIHSGVATPGKWSEPKNEIRFSIKKNTSDQNNSVVPSVPVANNPTIPEVVNNSLSAVCTVSNTSFMVGEQITINVTTSNLPDIYKINWSGISASKVKGFNKKALVQTLFAKKKGIIKPKVEIKNSKNSREKIKVSCPVIKIV
ncbi:MAG: hypothetical protein RLZZ517_444 [Candidatus Parcubacteria bacterium]|jgi:hypothetical protein